MTSTDKLRLLAADALAVPGFMTLRALRKDAHVVDFVCDFASAAAARLLRREAPELLGKPLLDVLGDPSGHAAVLDHYRRVVENATAEASNQWHSVNGALDLYRHGAVPLGDGVAVTLTNLSAAKRAAALRQDMMLCGVSRW